MPRLREGMEWEIKVRYGKFKFICFDRDFIRIFPIKLIVYGITLKIQFDFDIY